MMDLVHLLVVQPAGPARQELRNELVRCGHAVHVVDGAVEARDCLSEGLRPEVVLVEHRLPGTDAQALLEWLQEGPEGDGVAVILLVPEPLLPAMRLSPLWPADDYFAMGGDLSQLLHSVRLHIHRVHRWREALQRRHRALLSYLPHEIRTPLNGVLGCTEILADMVETRDQPGAAEVTELVGLVRESNDRLLTLVETVDLWLAVNDPSRSLAGRCDLSRGWSSVVARQIEALALRYQRAADLAVQLEDAPLPGSTAEWAKVCVLLVENALKFSQPGQSIKVVGAARGKGYTLSVRDQGRGMEPAQIAQVQEFAQFGRSSHEQQGLGLGLVTVRDWVQNHGGRMRLRGRREGGLEVSLHWAKLDFDPSAGTPDPETLQAGAAGR